MHCRAQHSQPQGVFFRSPPASDGAGLKRHCRVSRLFPSLSHLIQKFERRSRIVSLLAASLRQPPMNPSIPTRSATPVASRSPQRAIPRQASQASLGRQSFDSARSADSATPLLRQSRAMQRATTGGSAAASQQTQTVVLSESNMSTMPLHYGLQHGMVERRRDADWRATAGLPPKEVLLYAGDVQCTVLFQSGGRMRRVPRHLWMQIENEAAPGRPRARHYTYNAPTHTIYVPIDLPQPRRRRRSSSPYIEPFGNTA